MIVKRKVELWYEGSKSDSPFVAAYCASQKAALFIKRLWLNEEKTIRKAKIIKTKDAKVPKEHKRVVVYLLKKDKEVYEYYANYTGLAYMLAQVWCTKSFKKCKVVELFNCWPEKKIERETTVVFKKVVGR